MQTTASPIITAGMRQEPLLTADQIQAGVLFTGIGAANIWEIIEVTGHDPAAIMTIRKWPIPDHTTPVPTQVVAATCPLVVPGGIWKVAVQECLPSRPTKPRVMLIIPAEEIRQPESHVLYAGFGPNRVVKMVKIVGGKWSEALPILPSLCPMWAPPEGLRMLMEQGSDIDLI